MSATNETYGGRYAVIEPVGSGGMAHVYRARDELLGREVAVKVLSERLSTDSSFVERFRREAQAAANISHPNIVSLYDFGADNGTYFIVMEYIDGRPLSEIVRDEGPLLPERAAEIAADVATALQRAHATGLVHRDVKPGNIMITSSGQTKVTDFGIARALARDGDQTVTQTGMVIGTAAYLSPEQAQGNPVDARSDVYSLGCVLFEMLTGEPPFTGDSPLSIAYKHVREDAPPPSSTNPDVPEALDAITLKALAKNPDNRFSSATEMADDLQRFLSGQKVQATPVMAADTIVAPGAGATEVLGETVYEEPAPRRSAAWYVAVALVILGIFGLLAYLLATNLFGAADLRRVPQVFGLTEAEASERLEDAGFEVEVERAPSQQPDGTVFKQRPRDGERAEEGSTVTITVSEGPEQVTVPDLTGLTRSEATQELKDVNLKLGEVTEEPSDEFDEGQVIDQTPAADVPVDAGSEVDVVLSSGPEPVIVPSVVNQTEEDAIAEIEAAGLEAETTSAPSDAEAGIVIAQDPEAGAEASPGDVVRITVSEGPEERPMPNVIGQDAEDAEEFLEADYGLNVSQQPFNGACTEPPGAVCDQDPAPDTPVSPGDSATLFVQRGEASLPSPSELFAFLGLLG